jgi:hypothetical protein
MQPEAFSASSRTPRYANILQRFASNEVAPPANLRRDDALLSLRYLLIHALSEQHRGPWFHEQRNTEINSCEWSVLSIPQSLIVLLLTVATHNVVLVY